MCILGKVPKCRGQNPRVTIKVFSTDENFQSPNRKFNCIAASENKRRKQQLTILILQLEARKWWNKKSTVTGYLVKPSKTLTLT